MVDRDNNSFLDSTSDKRPSSHQIENTDEDKMPKDINIKNDGPYFVTPHAATNLSNHKMSKENPDQNCDTSKQSFKPLVKQMCLYQKVPLFITLKLSTIKLF